jgi:hypothetical protein
LRSFQFAIERYTFRSIRLKSSDLALFSTIYSPPHRRAALDNISYDVILPSYSLNRITKFENASEKEANNAALARAVQELFEILHSWGKQQGRNISLKLRAYSPTDPAYRRDLKLSSHQQFNDLKEHRYERSILQPTFSSIPSVSRIFSFISTDGITCSRPISPATIVSITAALPALKAVNWKFSDDEKKYPELRERQRHCVSPPSSLYPILTM